MPPLSLQDEARNTERKHFWNDDLKLRHTQVNFISAGASGKVTKQDESGAILARKASYLNDNTTENTNFSDPERSMADMSLDNRAQATVPPGLTTSSNITEESLSGLICVDGTWAESKTRTQNSDLFFVDTIGFKQAVKTGLPLPSVRRSESCSSVSSDEIILFRGRGRSRQPGGIGPKAHTSLIHNSTSTLPQAAKGQVIPDGSAIQLPGANTATDLFFSPQMQKHDEAKQNRVKDAIQITPKPPRRLKRGRPARNIGGDEGITDYIANIQQNIESDEQGSLEAWHRQGFDDPEPSPQKDKIGPSESETNPAPLVSSGWSDEDLHDLEELSTSSEILEVIDSILSKRERSSGVQYLVVWEGFTTDDAKWVPCTSLDTAAAAEMIALFETKERLNTQLTTKVDETDSDSHEDYQAVRDMARDMLEIDEQENEPEMMKARMTDEQIALRLAKQEELGLGSAELMLFDGDELEDWDNEENLKKLRAQAIQHTKRDNPKSGKSRSSFASASIFADVLAQYPYNGFDVMDRDRRSLRKRPKGRRGVLPPELSDSDFELSMQLAWDNDRAKKKVQKQHREELRAQGLLGKRDKVDLNDRYAEGISIGQMKNEIKDFLMSDRVSVSFPPMDKKDRKLIHEFANVFNLKSKSVGGGRGRYPTLFKTSHSIQFSEGKLGDVEALLNQRRFLPRLGKGSKRGSGSLRTAGRGGGAPGPAVSYRDGEIVGAAAPELGTDNKGRAMLEKMGWSSGTALGALNNKGIMQPVVHIVKTTKAGLG
ncbi:hypothetical protein MMC11_002479 [Xylographa trunciseda]|nr:hypothetical protein [Xylographa trunciseda]